MNQKVKRTKDGRGRQFPERLYFPTTGNWRKDKEDSGRLCYENKIDALTYRHTEWVAEYRLVRVRHYRYQMQEIGKGKP